MNRDGWVLKLLYFLSFYGWIIAIIIAVVAALFSLNIIKP